MKTLIIALIISITTVAGSIAYTNHLEDISLQMLEKNSQICTELQNDNFIMAAEKTAELAELVEEKRSLMDAVGNHQELDEIEQILYELKSYSENEEKSYAMAKCQSLDFLMKSLPKNFKIKLENIL